MTGKSIRILGVALLFVGALVVSQPAAMADVYTLQLANVAAPWDWSMGPAYVSPYLINVTDQTTGSTATQLALACDDFTTNISQGLIWDATLNTFANVGTSTKFTTPLVGATIQQDYIAAGLLADQILTHYAEGEMGSFGDWASNPGFYFGEYSYALWNIFDPDQGTQPGAISIGATDKTLALQIMNGALAQALISTDPEVVKVVNGLQIYTPCGGGNLGTSGCVPGDTKASQEFLGITVPEGSALPFLPFDLLALFGGILLVRRRILAS